MKKFTVSNDEIIESSGGDPISFPKYTSQIINLANQNAQGTRPKTVGQLSELTQEYAKQANKPNLEGWKKWYLEKHPKAIDDASDKILKSLNNLKNVIPLIDEKMIHAWVEDLIFNKTFKGLNIQEAILKKLAAIQNKPYKMASPKEESLGIDGYVKETAYSIKPTSYKFKEMLSEVIEAKVLYYTETKTGLTVTLE